MNSDSIIKKVCCCLELLLDEKPPESKVSKQTVKDEVLQCNLEQNINETIQVISNNSYFNSLLSSYRHSEWLNSGCVYWDFVALCLMFLKTSCEALLLQEQESCGTTHEIQPPKGILSISQEKLVRKCLQFVIALGIIPNLMPIIKQVLRQKTAVVDVLETLDMESCPKKKYYRVISCLQVLVDCLRQTCFQSIILTHHSADLLTILFQICYAPIKKLDDSKVTDCTVPEFDNTTTMKPATGSSNHEFSKVMLKIKECPTPTDEEFIKEMFKDRKHFKDVLEQLLNQINPSVLLWELLFLQGINFKFVQSVPAGRVKLPIWFQRVCNQILTEKIMSPSGVENLIKVALDKMCDADMKTGLASREKIDAISKLIAMNKVKHLPIELYIKCISNQVLDLFRIKGSAMDQVLSCVASSIMLHLAERNVQLAECHIFNVIFKPLLQVFDAMDPKSLVKEEDITQCIEDIHSIFVCSTSILSQEAMKILLPFYHLLFIMYVKLVNGVLFIKTQIQDLLLAILNNSDEDDAVKLLQLCTFEDVTLAIVRSVTDLQCVLGYSGGVHIIRKNRPSMEDALQDINDKCQALLCLVSKVSDKKLKVSYFLSLLKRLTLVENDRRQVSIDTGDVSVFFDHLIYLHLLEELSEQLGDDLVNDADKAIELISAVLSCSISSDPCNEESVQISEEKLLTVLPILSAIIGYKEQLTYKHWTDMKQCLSSLGKLIASTREPFIKDMACDISMAIRTHGAVDNCTNNTKKLSATVDNDQSFVTKISALSEQLLATMNNSNFENEASTSRTIPADFFASSSDCVNKLQEHSHPRPKIEEIIPKANRILSKQSGYTQALKDAGDSCLPTRGHGLLTLCKLVEAKDEETLSHKTNVLHVFKENLSDEDSYIYLSAIRGLSTIADIDPEIVFPILLSELENCGDEKLDLVLKIGEVLLKICQNLGEVAVKYRDVLLNTFLRGTRHAEPQIRASSLSNLGEVCKRLRFSVGISLQEILLCVKSLLKTDPDVMVRRSAIHVLRLLLQGTGKDTFKILEGDIRDIYSLLRWTYQVESDDVVKLQCQLAIEEVDIIVKDALKKPLQIRKEIHISDAF